MGLYFSLWKEKDGKKEMIIDRVKMIFLPFEIFEKIVGEMEIDKEYTISGESLIKVYDYYADIFNNMSYGGVRNALIDNVGFPLLNEVANEVENEYKIKIN